MSSAYEDRAQAAFGVRPENAESRTARRRRTDGETRRPPGKGALDGDFLVREHSVDIELPANLVAERRKTADVFVGCGCLSPPFAQHDLVVDQVEKGVGIVTQRGLAFQEFLDGHGLALAPAADLFSKVLFPSIEADANGRRRHDDGWRVGGKRRLRTMPRPDQGDAGIQIAIADSRELFADRRAGLDGSQALLRGTVVKLEVHVEETIEYRTATGVELALLEEDLGERSSLVASPGVECREQRSLADQAGLNCEQPEEQVAVNLDLRHAEMLPEIDRRMPARGNLARERVHPSALACTAWIRLSHALDFDSKRCCGNVDAACSRFAKARTSSIARLRISGASRLALTHPQDLRPADAARLECHEGLVGVLESASTSVKASGIR